MIGINAKRLTVKSLVKYRFYMERLSSKKNIAYSLIFALMALIICISAASFWIAPHRTSVQSLNVLPNCLPISEPVVISESKRISYFPLEAFNNDPELGEVKNKTFPTSLMFMGEPSFLTLPECAGKAYRFLWLRAFHRPIAVRVWQSGEEFYLVAKKLDKEGYLKDVQYRTITKSEWATLESHIEQASFWSLPTFGEVNGDDGDFWIFEGAQGGQYHIVERWSPPDEKYRAIGIYLLNLSGLQTEDR